MSAFYRLEDYRLTAMQRNVGRLAEALVEAGVIERLEDLVQEPKRTDDSKPQGVVELYLANDLVTAEHTEAYIETDVKRAVESWCQPGSFLEVYNDDERVSTRVTVTSLWKAEIEWAGFSSPIEAQREIEALREKIDALEYRNAVIGGARATGSIREAEAPKPGEYPLTSEDPYELTQEDVEKSFDPALVETEQVAWIRIWADGSQAIAECHLTDDEDSPNGLGWYFASYEWKPEYQKWVEYDGGMLWGYQNADELLVEMPWPKTTAGKWVVELPISVELAEKVGVWSEDGGSKVPQDEILAAMADEQVRVENLLGQRNAALDEMLEELERANRSYDQERYRRASAEEHVAELKTKARQAEGWSASYEWALGQRDMALEQRDNAEKHRESLAEKCETLAANRDELARELACAEESIEKFAGGLDAAMNTDEIRGLAEACFGRWGVSSASKAHEETAKQAASKPYTLSELKAKTATGGKKVREVPKAAEAPTAYRTESTAPGRSERR